MQKLVVLLLLIMSFFAGFQVSKYLDKKNSHRVVSSVIKPPVHQNNSDSQELNVNTNNSHTDEIGIIDDKKNQESQQIENTTQKIHQSTSVKQDHQQPVDINQNNTAPQQQLQLLQQTHQNAQITTDQQISENVTPSVADVQNKKNVQVQNIQQNQQGQIAEIPTDFAQNNINNTKEKAKKKPVKQKKRTPKNQGKPIAKVNQYE